MTSVADMPVSGVSDLRQTIKVLSRVSTARALYHAFECWLIITLAVYVSVFMVPLASGVLGAVVYLMVLAVIASRQHALMVLTHEGIHKRLSRSLGVNDWLARLTMAFPVFISLSKWRFIHLYHHQAPHTVDDPDRAIYARYPIERKNFLHVLLRDLCGLNVLSTLKYFMDVPFVARAFNRRFLGEDRVRKYQNVSDRRSFWIFLVVMCGGGFLLGGRQFLVVLLLYWLLPFCTFTQVLFRIRGAIEHGNVPDPRNPYRQTRTYLLNPLLGFFFAPKQVNYHLEHHLYPSIPFYHLPEMHEVLRQWVYPREHGYCEPFVAGVRKLVR